MFAQKTKKKQNFKAPTCQSYDTNQFKEDVAV